MAAEVVFLGAGWGGRLDSAAVGPAAQCELGSLSRAAEPLTCDLLLVIQGTTAEKIYVLR